jgi:hypothetical protein
MKTAYRYLLPALALCLAGLLLPTPALAEHHESSPGGLEMTPEMQEAFALGTPGPEHEFFEHFVGQWTYESKYWMDPSQPPMTTLGKASAEMILDGRFLQTHYYGDFMGIPFHGLGIDGFDRVQGKHVAVWLDNMGTMIMTMAGTLDDSGKVLKMVSEYVDPMTRKPTKAKTITTIINKNEHKFEYFSPGPDGKYFKAMEMDYKRR